MPPRKQARNASANKKRNRHRSKSQSADPYVTGKVKDGSCPFVGIGGSAGGFEAAMELLRHLPARTGMACVIVQHLDPHHGSRLANLLGKATSMPVSEIAETTTPKPNEVYVQPPNKCVIAKNGKLTLVSRTEKLNVAIDHFFESLAEDCGSRGIGIVLSGTGSDGTAGLRAIKAAGGLTFAQTEESAKFDAMPRSAIRSGFVDLVLAPDAIAREIQRIADHPYLKRPLIDAEGAEKEAYRQADDLGRVFLSLKKQMGVDFSGYKESTLIRRIHRRMALHRIDTLKRYARFLRDNKKEIESLFDDLQEPRVALQRVRSEEHTSELQSRGHIVCRLLLEKKNITNVRSSLMAVNIHITIIALNALHTKRQNLFQEIDAVINLLMEDKNWGLRKSRNATSLNSRYKSLDTLKVKIIRVTFRRVIRTNHKKASKIWRHYFFLMGASPSGIYTLSLHDALPI